MGQTKLKEKVTLSGGTMDISTQVGEITKPLALVDEMVNSGLMLVMHKTSCCT